MGFPKLSPDPRDPLGSAGLQDPQRSTGCSLDVEGPIDVLQEVPMQHAGDRLDVVSGGLPGFTFSLTVIHMIYTYYIYIY